MTEGGFIHTHSQLQERATRERESTPFLEELDLEAVLKASIHNRCQECSQKSHT